MKVGAGLRPRNVLRVLPRSLGLGVTSPRAQWERDFPNVDLQHGASRCHLTMVAATRAANVFSGTPRSITGRHAIT